jgi:hypothetical protein
MAERHHRAIDDTRRLKGLVAQERAESIRQQIAAANTVLTVANTELDLGRAPRANTLIEKMWNLAAKVRLHLNEPNHVPSTEAKELHTDLKNMEDRIRALAKRVSEQRAIVPPEKRRNRCNIAIG